MRREDLTQDELKAILRYDPETGIFTWLQQMATTVLAGQRAGSLDTDGYVRIGIRGARYHAPRLAWLYVHGRWPPADIDHINGIRDDNRLANLREATRRQNQYNKAPWAASGIKGVYWDKRRQLWRATLRLPDGTYISKRYASKEAAAAFHREQAARLHGDFVRFE